MYHALLQVNPASAAFQLTNYGPLGIVAFLFICVIVYLEKIRRASDVKTAEKIARLEDKVDKIQTEDRAKMLEVIQHNTDIMEEVVTILQKNKP